MRMVYYALIHTVFCHTTLFFGGIPLNQIKCFLYKKLLWVSQTLHLMIYTAHHSSGSMGFYPFLVCVLYILNIYYINLNKWDIDNKFLSCYNHVSVKLISLYSFHKLAKCFLTEYCFYWIHEFIVLLWFKFYGIILIFIMISLLFFLVIILSLL